MGVEMKEIDGYIGERDGVRVLIVQEEDVWTSHRDMLERAIDIIREDL